MKNREEIVKECAEWAAESAFQSLSDARGGDNLVTTDDDSSLCDFALDSFENIGEIWTEDELDMADSIISKRVWELTTVAE